ncbi:MAG TPA: polysaccharide biosynthesis C-terminal domain-containing protein [Terracidiphilus sp.]|nr:polysaccharide biosynthesis C-terminal domain-containing protein [Terracidiphilus sp.]
MKRLGLTVAKNGLANIVRGCATAAVALALPHFLTRALDHDRFSAWALMLQLAAYASYLDFGLQTAVARYLAQAIERNDIQQRNKLISTAFLLLAAAGVLAFAIVGGMVLILPHLFHQIPPALDRELRLGLLVLAANAALMLPLSTFTGILIGLRRNELPALAIGGSRILGAIAVIAASSFTQSLVWLAVCLAMFSVLGGLIQWMMAKHQLPDLVLQRKYLDRGMMRELLHYCSGLTVFSLAMLFISGLDVTIVGYFTFSAVGYYAIASTAITFVAGLSNAVFAAMMAPVAVLQARGELTRIRDLVIRMTRLSSYASLAITLPAFVYGYAALKLWVGSAYAVQALPILEILLVAQAIRLIANSNSTMLIATGQQQYGILVAVIEAVSNVVLSIAGAIWLGPIGVAWGTLIGASVSIISIFPFTMRWAKEVPIPALRFFREGILLPLLASSPVILCLILLKTQNPTSKTLKLLVLATVFSVLLAVFSRRLSPALPKSGSPAV